MKLKYIKLKRPSYFIIKEPEVKRNKTYTEKNIT